jgi:membrane-bound serine protease (ClpP class)
MSVWIPILLFVVGFVSLFLELFVPAAGAIGAAGIISMIVATVLGYRNFGTTMGTLLLTGTLIGTPAMIVIGLKLFPKTFVGKLLILGDSQKREEGYASYSEQMYEGLAGKEGTAATVLRPSGMVVIGDKKYSVVTSGEMIERGEPVRVVKVEGSRIVVREIRDKTRDKTQEKTH